MAMNTAEFDEGALVTDKVIGGLKDVYRKVVMPVERDFKYDMYFDSPLQDVDFDSKPMILVLGQYSTGKTTFIRHLIGRDFPGMRIGPEPTTDKFACVYYGLDDITVPGTVLQTNPEMPFKGLGKFGNNFLSKFEGSQCASNALKSFMFVDTPGVLSGKKQTNRQYPYLQVVSWFAERAARILLLFDCNKLDVSDEFKEVIGAIRQHDEKIRVILNKADSIPERALIRVYGALMWSLGKVFKTPEVLRVYISSFSDQPLNNKNYCYQLFKEEGAELIGELKGLPRKSALNKINELIRRIRLVKVHCQILSELRKEMPTFFGKKSKQKKIIEELPNKFREIARKIGVAPSDFPSLNKFKETLMEEDLSKYPKYSQKKIDAMDLALEKTIPELVKRLNDASYLAALMASRNNDLADNFNPFEASESLNSPKVKNNWELTSTVSRASKAMSALRTTAGRMVSATRINNSMTRTSSNQMMSAVETAREFSHPQRQSQVRAAPAQNHVQEMNVDELDQSAAIKAASEGGVSGSSNKIQKDPLSEKESIKVQGNSDTGNVRSSKRQVSRPSLTNVISAGLSEPGSDHDLELETEEAGTSNEKASPPMPLKPLSRDSNVTEEWVVTLLDKTESDNIFFRQRLRNNKLTGSAARKAFAPLDLPNKLLNQIWMLVDFNKTNELDAEQFALAMWLGRRARKGEEVPERLAWNMIPPSHRDV